MINPTLTPSPRPRLCTIHISTRDTRDSPRRERGCQDRDNFLSLLQNRKVVLVVQGEDDKEKYAKTKAAEGDEDDDLIKTLKAAMRGKGKMVTFPQTLQTSELITDVRFLQTLT